MQPNFFNPEFELKQLIFSVLNIGMLLQISVVQRMKANHNYVLVV